MRVRSGTDWWRSEIGVSVQFEVKLYVRLRVKIRERSGSCHWNQFQGQDQWEGNFRSRVRFKIQFKKKKNPVQVWDKSKSQDHDQAVPPLQRVSERMNVRIRKIVFWGMKVKVGFKLTLHVQFWVGFRVKLRVRLMFRIRISVRFRVKINVRILSVSGWARHCERQGQLKVKVGFHFYSCWQELSCPPTLPPLPPLHWPNLHNPGHSLYLIPLITFAKSLLCVK